jgi:hypothetical protein
MRVTPVCSAKTWNGRRIFRFMGMAQAIVKTVAFAGGEMNGVNTP